MTWAFVSSSPQPPPLCLQEEWERDDQPRGQAVEKEFSQPPLGTSHPHTPEVPEAGGQRAPYLCGDVRNAFLTAKVAPELLLLPHATPVLG